MEPKALDKDQTTAKLCKRVSVELTRIDQNSQRQKEDTDSSSSRWQTLRKMSSDSCSSADTEIYERSEDTESSQEPDEKLEKEKNFEKFQSNTKKTLSNGDIKTELKTHYLSKWELQGLHRMINWLESLPVSKKGVPRDMLDPEAVLNDMKVHTYATFT